MLEQLQELQKFHHFHSALIFPCVLELKEAIMYEFNCSDMHWGFYSLIRSIVFFPTLSFTAIIYLG